MPRTEPVEDATFPLYRVKAVCSNETCSRKGWIKTFHHYPEGTVIRTHCSRCVDRWEAGLRKLQLQSLGILRAKGQQDKPEHSPLEHKPHWTEKIP